MNLPIAIIGVVLLTLLLSVTLLIRYALIGRTIIQNTQMRLFNIEKEVRLHPLTCPLKLQIEKQTPTTIPAENPFLLTEYLQSRILTSEKEKDFRNSFASAHPNALHRLRSICPRTTRADELLCMLILLKQNNEEISYLLGISRSSVLKNRYRLRCKLKLPEGIDLDAEVHRLLSSDAE